MSDRKIFVELAEVRTRCAELGVDPKELRSAVEYGIAFQAECTKHDPPWLKGMLPSGKAIRKLRDDLVTDGWTCDDNRGYATVVHPSGEHAIAVASGDANTGTERTPATRTEKGPATRDAITQNQMQLADIQGSTFERVPIRKRTWLLLHYFDKEKEETRIELSLPTSMTVDGHVASWFERIILPIPGLAPIDDFQSDNIDVEVTRRDSDAA